MTSTADVPTWAVVPTKNKPKMVLDLLESLRGQVAAAVVVDNNDVCDAFTLGDDLPVYNVWHPGYPPNLSQLYNIGIDCVDTLLRNAYAEWDVALLNDDVLCPAGWVRSLGDAMRATPAVVAYTDRQGRSQPTLYTTPPTNPFDTCTFWACVVRGEAKLRYDEDFLWWYGDTDWDYRARQRGGVLAVPGEIPRHLTPSASLADPVLAAQTHRDRETFARKWNGAPW